MNLCMRNMTNYLFFVCSEREIGTYLLCYINFSDWKLISKNREYYLKLKFILSCHIACINTYSSNIYIIFKMTTILIYFSINYGHFYVTTKDQLYKNIKKIYKKMKGRIWNILSYCWIRKNIVLGKWFKIFYVYI